ncbi:hypothetical protein Ahy_B10g105082 [Arachis hypogaea]|uniref:Uncharacterized protein n=1 Tax=Arachis hypogaea TaxID=3818 RepID=A0A444X732_ARAHY|nr:hypothetical protein Ahy_B10g105082 [Arachis hypogaea]
MEQFQSNPQPQDNAVQDSQTGSSRGGIYRMKYHLAKILGQIKVCNKVTEDVELQFKRLLEENKKNKAEKKKFASDCYDVKTQAEEECEPNPVQPPAPATMGDKGKRRAILATPIGSYFKGRTTPGSQPTLKSVLASKQVVHKVKLGLAKWIIDALNFWVMADEDDPEFINGGIEGIENLIYTDNAMPSYPKDGGDVEVDVDLLDVADYLNTASFGDIFEDGGFGLSIYDRDIGTLNDDYDL